jgi:hypothetical protein
MQYNITKDTKNVGNCSIRDKATGLNSLQPDNAIHLAFIRTSSHHCLSRFCSSPDYPQRCLCLDWQAFITIREGQRLTNMRTMSTLFSCSKYPSPTSSLKPYLTYQLALYTLDFFLQNKTKKLTNPRKKTLKTQPQTCRTFLNLNIWA